jgi:hypothetical protein
LIPLLASCDDPSQIDWDALPDRFVVNLLHGSSCNILSTDKSRLDIPDAMRKCMAGWAHLYPMSREWPYLGVKPRISWSSSGRSGRQGPYVYKILCFGGERLRDRGRGPLSGHKANFLRLSGAGRYVQRHSGYDGDGRVRRAWMKCWTSLKTVERHPHIRIAVRGGRQGVFGG